MYSELIYTRCRQGIDILKGGRPVLSDGFKVYSCSKDILDGDVADLPLLFNMAQSKQTYSDPNFMDDVYIYAVPDKGRNILVNFHPIPFDRDAKGDYSHRPGNFVNQVFVGGFGDVYPFELFGNVAVWDAQTRGEAFYYENEPQPLACRSELDATVGSITVDDIERFVLDGRRDAVKTAVAFLIEQYGLPLENRKYLVIRDESSSFLELWVAAIELSLSPRMSSGLPFATRMDKFMNTNRYTVNQNGLYQVQMNLQDPKQKQRFRAMIVGVDERDRANISAVRALPNAPYIILDGKSKTIDYSADTSSAYYSLVTSYNERHIVFCREFLQMLDIGQPTKNVLKLYDAYIVLDGGFSSCPVRKVAAALTVLEAQQMLPCIYLSRLYNGIKEALPHYLKEDLFSAFTILKWLQKAASIVGDAQAAKEFDTIVCKAFADRVYGDPLDSGTSEFWSSISNSAFAGVAAGHLTSGEVFDSHRLDTAKYGADDWIAFCRIYLPCAKKANAYTVDGIYDVVRSGVDACIQSAGAKKALEICGLMFQVDPAVSKDLLVRLSCETDGHLSKQYIWLLLRSDTKLMSTDQAAIDFVHYMQKQGQEELCGYIMEYRANVINQTPEMEYYLDALLGDQTLRNVDLSKIYAILDSKLQLNGKSSVRMAAKLQETRSKNDVCPISAHICALNALGGKGRRNSIINEFESYAKQGFPSIEDSEYVEKLVKALLSSKLGKDEFDLAVGMLASSQPYVRTLSREVIGITTERNSYAWNVLIDALSAEKNPTAMAALSDECVAARKSEKQMNQLLDMLDSSKARAYFPEVVDDVQQKKESKSPRPGLGRLFGFGGKKR